MRGPHTALIEPPATPPPARRRSLVRQASLTSLVAAGAVAMGLLRDVVIAATFGAGPITDSFFVAARLPLGFAAIMVAAANQALIPAFTRSLAEQGEDETWLLVSRLVTAGVVFGTLVVILVELVSRPLLFLIAPGLPASEAALAAQLLPICFAMVPLSVTSEILRALLNARYSFVVPAAANIALSATAAGLVLAVRHDPHVLAWGYLAGSVMQALVLAGWAARDGFRFRPSLRLRDSGFLTVGRLSIRPLIAAGLNPIARIGEQVILSFLPPGSITIAAYGYRLISAIGGTVFFRSVMVTLLPRLTAADGEADLQAVNRIVQQGLRLMLALSLPLTAFVAVLGTPVALAIFQRGRFTRAEAILLGAALTIYSFSLVGSAVQRALLAPFLGRLDTRTPLRNTIYGVLANLALLPLAVLSVGGHRLGVLGVALAYSLAQYVNVAHAAYRVRQTFGTPWRRLGRTLLILGTASLGAAAAMLVVLGALGRAWPSDRLHVIVSGLAAGLAGLLALAGLVLVATRGTADLKRL